MLVMDLGVCVKGWAVQKMGGPTLMICASYDVLLCKELPFGVTMISHVLFKFLVSLIF